MDEFEGKKRVIIEHVTPQINCGEFAIKRAEGEKVIISADIYGDSHDVVVAKLRYKHVRQRNWHEVEMTFIENDHWEGIFLPDKKGTYEYTVTAWIDHPLSWQHDIKKKITAGQDVRVELVMGANFLEQIIPEAKKADQRLMTKMQSCLTDESKYEMAKDIAIGEELLQVFRRYPDRQNETTYNRILRVEVERKKALFSAWYEFFPRSASLDENQHGTFKDCENLLPRIAEMGFDIVYLPPVHPIGKSFRKGKNNSTNAFPGEPGSPWAIGAPEGGHKAIHTDLGTLDEFKEFIEKAKEFDIEIALDIAFQCSQDHPYVKEHPQWFKWRPDGTVQYAENPPKKYQDVLPLNFETDDWKNLWHELLTVFLYWIKQGVRIFRVDNPHTKPFRFWSWLIDEVHAKYPDVIFLSEAFTRPKIMKRLAKEGFTQSYTYFTWRNHKKELTAYMTELTKSNMRNYFRPNFWPNTPDINPFELQGGNEAAFKARFILAATLSSNYGFYGPVYEFMIHEPVHGKEEYCNSEKYEIKNWDWQKKTSFMDLIGKVNNIRKNNPALQTTWNIEFCEIDNDQLIGYYKYSDDRKNQLLVVVNLDYVHRQSGWLRLPWEKMMTSHLNVNYKMHDLLTGSAYYWNKEINYVELNPSELPAHIFLLEEINIGG